MRPIFKFAMMLAVASLLAAPASAQIWDETANGGGDAGDFPTGSFQLATDGMTYNQIQGSLDPIDVDAYCITILSDTWSADVIAGTETDTRLWLFDLAGNYLMGNDDSSPTGGTLQSYISNTASFAANSDGGDGTLVDSPTDPVVGQDVILVINGFADDALDTAGANLTQMNANFDSLVGIDPASTGTFGSWEGVSQGGGTYDILLTGAQLTSIPEPVSLSLVAFGLVGISTRRRRS